MVEATAPAIDFADGDDDAAICAVLNSAAPVAKLPWGYSLKADGLYYDDGGDAPALRIASRMEVLAQTRDDKGASWGLLLRWKDSDHRDHQWAMPMPLLAGDGSEIRATLLDRGCYIAPSPKARSKLLDFLGSVTIPARARAVERVGWTGNAFALPDRTIGDGKDSLVIYQGPSAFDHQYRSAGTLKQWQDGVACYGVGNSRLAVSLAAAFVGPLLDLIGEEGGGINLRGPSSIGKSTALVAAASVWGTPSFVRQWRATANGLEGVAVQHNDTLLCLDELAQLDAKDAGSVAYMLANGAGKTRSSKTGAARSPAQWRVFFLSSGEISLGDLAGRDGRGTRRSAAGQEVRILDVEADAGAGLGLFETLHGVTSPELLARTLKDGAAHAYGTAGPAFLEMITANRDTIAPSLKRGIDGFVAKHLPKGATGQVARACRRFAVVAMAGEVAARVGVLPWPPGKAETAAAKIFGSWLQGRGGIGAAEDREAISKVRGFLEAHGSSRFEPIERGIDEYAPRIVNRAGFWRHTDGVREHVILPEVWRNEVCAGMDAGRVARALGERGMLRKNAEGKFTIPTRLPELGLSRCYIVEQSIFGGDDA